MSHRFDHILAQEHSLSPGGTATTAKLASLYTDGAIAEGQNWRQEGIVGTIFDGSVKCRRRSDPANDPQHGLRDGRVDADHRRAGSVLLGNRLACRGGLRPPALTGGAGGCKPPLHTHVYFFESAFQFSTTVIGSDDASD